MPAFHARLLRNGHLLCHRRQMLLPRAVELAEPLEDKPDHRPKPKVGVERGLAMPDLTELHSDTKLDAARRRPCGVNHARTDSLQDGRGVEVIAHLGFAPVGSLLESASRRTSSAVAWSSMARRAGLASIYSHPVMRVPEELRRRPRRLRSSKRLDNPASDVRGAPRSMPAQASTWSEPLSTST